jgi:hypothetical protein
MKNIDLKHMVECADSAKKVNVLDLSSDQDLTIGMMNLLFIKDYLNNDSDLSKIVHNIQSKLMDKIVKKSDKNRLLSEQLLLESMRLMVDGDKQLASGNKDDAYKLYDSAYEKYSLFWGINMELIDAGDIK